MYQVPTCRRLCTVLSVVPLTSNRLFLIDGHALSFLGAGIKNKDLTTPMEPPGLANGRLGGLFGVRP